MEGQALSQEEINLLMNGVITGQEDTSEAPGRAAAILSAMDKEILAGTIDVSMKKAAESLSQLIKRPVKSGFPAITETSWDDIKKSGIMSPERLAARVSYVEGLKYDNYLIITRRDAAVIVDLMMGGAGKVVTEDLDDLKMSAVGEAMNQMIGSSATAFSDIFGKRVVISTPTLKTASLYEEDRSFNQLVSEKMILVDVSLTILSDSAISTEIYQLIPIANAIDMVNNSLTHGGRENTVLLPRPAGQTSRVSTETQEANNKSDKKVTVQTVQFMPFDADDSKRETEVNKLELIYDVGMQLTVELGRTEKTLKEILEMGPGSIVGLDKLAGEPLDILVNGKLLAKGEVIVIDENYGVRIKEILNSRERLGSLKNRS